MSEPTRIDGRTETQVEEQRVRNLMAYRAALIEACDGQMEKVSQLFQKHLERIEETWLPKEGE